MPGRPDTLQSQAILGTRTLIWINIPHPDLHQRRRRKTSPECPLWNIRNQDMMNGYDMGYGGLGMWVMLALAVLAIAALIKYLRR